MSKKKKSRKRQKKNSNKYTKKQFIGVVCKQCRICKVYDPYFCYDSVYKEWPRAFIENTYPKLLKLRPLIKTSGLGRNYINRFHFADLFCCSEPCNNSEGISCHMSLQCFNYFRDQILAINSTCKVKPITQSKQRVVKAYPTFFISNDETFRKSVEDVLNEN